MALILGHVDGPPADRHQRVLLVLEEARLQPGRRRHGSFVHRVGPREGERGSDPAPGLFALPRAQGDQHGALGGEAHRGVAYGDEALTTDLKSGRREYVYDVADFTFGAFGFSDRVVAVESDCLHVVLGADSMMGVTIAVGATLAAVRGDPFKSVRVELSDGAVWLCQMDLYSAFRAAADDFEKQVALMRIQAGWRSLDGGTAWASSPVLRNGPPPKSPRR